MGSSLSSALVKLRIVETLPDWDRYSGVMTKTSSFDPLAALGPELTDEQKARYPRNLKIPEIGEAGQRRLLGARVLVIGAGGLGSPVLLYLAAAGVGHIGVVDDDVVDVSNMQRQVIHSFVNIGELKVESAARRMQSINPDIQVTTFAERLTAENFSLVGDEWDLIVDACDNFATRYLISDYAEKIGVPDVMGAVFRWEGQVSTFWSNCPDPQRALTLRDLYSAEPAADAPSREPQAGILGAVCATIGGIMATEVVKLLIGAGDNLAGRVLYYDAFRMTLREVSLTATPGSR